jgi:hypothetical protein
MDSRSYDTADMECVFLVFRSIFQGKRRALKSHGAIRRIIEDKRHSQQSIQDLIDHYGLLRLVHIVARLLREDHFYRSIFQEQAPKEHRYSNGFPTQQGLPEAVDDMQDGSRVIVIPRAESWLTHRTR